MPTQRDTVVFFIDRCLGSEPIRSALIQAGATVELHDDWFARDEADDVWLPRVAERRWVVLTKDKRIRYRPAEKEALQRSGARVFVLTAGDLRGSEIAQVFVAALPKLHKVLERQPGGFIAAVTRNAEVRLYP